MSEPITTPTAEVSARPERVAKRRFAFVAALGTLVASVAFVGGTTTTGALSGSVSFSSSGTWMVPAGIDTIEVTLIGGGGGSGGTNASTNSYGEGGPGSQVAISMDVTPGDEFKVDVGGAGGNGYGKSDFGNGSSSGYGSGGDGDTGSGTGGAGAGGGGASRLYLRTTNQTVAVAGGGGGGGGAGMWGSGGRGGGGDRNGTAGSGVGSGSAGTGSTGSSHGSDGGNASTGSSAGGGGGGGAGWWGGRGGGGGKAGGGGGGGGAGGENYVRSSLAERTANDWLGGSPRSKGSVKITYSGTHTTQTTVTASPGNAVVGQHVTLRAKVTTEGTTTVPSGVVQFTVGGSQLGGARPVPADGIVEISTDELPVGTTGVRAAFQPSNTDDYKPSTGSTTVTVSKGDTSMILSHPIDTTPYGARATFTARVGAVAPAVGTPSGNVQFFADGTELGAPAPLDGSGEAILETTGLEVGPSEITAVYAGSSDFEGSDAGPTTHTVQTAPSRTALTTAKNPTVFGEHMTITATVRGVGSTLAPTGAVRFSADGVTLDTVSLDASSQAVLSGAGLGVGAHEVIATYLGDGGFAGSTADSFTQRVDKGDVAVVVVSPSAPGGPDDPITLAATVNVQAPADGTPTGQIQFLRDGHPLGSPVPVSGGGASIDVNGLPVGTHRIAATYSGDRNFHEAVSTPVGFDIDPIEAAIVVSSSVNPSLTGQAVRFTAEVTGDGPGIPTGPVTFFVDGVELDTVNLGPAGRAVLTTDGLAVGAHGITAVYAGDGAFTDAGSDGSTQVVEPGEVTVAIAPPTAPSAVGDIVDVRAAVTVMAPAAGAPTGDVQFLVGGVPHGDPVPVVEGRLTGQLMDLPVGTHPVTAAYAGDGDFSAATSRPVTFGVDARTPEVGLTSSITQGVVGDPARFTSRVSPTMPSGPAPTGTVTFLVDGAVVDAPVQLGPDGTASMVVDTLGTGVSTVNAAYSGDGNYREAISEPVNVDLVVPEAPVEPVSPVDGLVINNNLDGADAAGSDAWSTNGSTTGRAASAGGGTGTGAGASSLPATGSRTLLLTAIGSFAVVAGAGLVSWRRRMDVAR